MNFQLTEKLAGVKMMLQGAKVPWAISDLEHVTALEKRIDSFTVDSVPVDLFDENYPYQGPLDGADGTVAVIFVDGVILKGTGLDESVCDFFGICELDNLLTDIQAVKTDPSVTTCLVIFNSPGGSALGVPEATAAIADLASTVNVIGYTETECCSGAMWLSSGCSAFYCSPSSCVGSIGVYQLIVDQSRQLENAGIKVNSVSAGKYKLAGASWAPLTEQDRALFQAQVDKIYSQFKSAMTTNRQVDDSVMQGQTFDGEDAVNANLSDGTLNSVGELIQLLDDSKG